MDPSFYESDDQKYQILMKNDQLRHEIFGDVLSVHLGLETDVDLKSDDIKYTKGFFLGRHEVIFTLSFWIKIKEINSKNFSIIWEGFILPPYSGEYSFTLTADNGGVLFVNEKVIISHNIGTITDSIKNKLISIISPSNETGKKIET